MSSRSAQFSPQLHQLLTADQAGEYLGLTPGQVRARAKKSEIKDVRVGDLQRFSVDDLDVYAAKRLLSADIISMSVPAERVSGIYFLIQNSEIVYIGKSVDAAGRLVSHIHGKKVKFDRLFFMRVATSKLDEVERHYISTFNPGLNRTFRTEPEKERLKRLRVAMSVLNRS